MTLISVSLQHDRLAKSIGCQIYLLYIIRTFHKRVRAETSQVHDDTVVNQFRHILRTVRVIHNITVCNGAVLPVCNTIIIQIRRDADLCTRQLADRRILIICGSRIIAILIIPRGTGQRNRVASVIARHSAVPKRLGVAPQTCTQAVAGKKSISVGSGIVCCKSTLKCDLSVAGAVNVTGIYSSLKLCVRLTVIDRDQV